MDGRGNHGESVAIIGMACRFPGARDPAEFHDLAVAGRGMFQPAAACVPRMRCAEDAGPSGSAPAGAMCGAGAGNPGRSVI
jgi:Beta-ketoacyl synthase, N-terminal domain